MSLARIKSRNSVSLGRSRVSPEYVSLKRRGIFHTLSACSRLDKPQAAFEGLFLLFLGLRCLPCNR
jgi:hypothetical protein